ncbi:MAG: hypothetical protein F4Z58_14550 [Acidimicrobiaceae bacterium]|nr:hypothetical protein [Acidimicrobiaceae bacterium]MYD06819.1 hypothetical protein [Acidimicrobiaceae bacterium]MYI57952.1 hypothetical protein [Acidimicrobiaceae bacterium]
MNWTVRKTLFARSCSLRSRAARATASRSEHDDLGSIRSASWGRIQDVRRQPENWGSECGQAVPMMVVLLLAALVVVAIARLGAAADDSARARTAADAAALAGAAQGFAAATELAEANGGSLLDYTAFGNQVEVRVQVGSGVAVARAERTVVWESPASSPEARAARPVARAAR